MKILMANLTRMVGQTGGLAKMSVEFANEMYRRGHEIVFIYSDEKLGNFYFPLNKNIPRYDMRHYKGQEIPFPWYLRFYRELLRPINKKKAQLVNFNFQRDFIIENIRSIMDEFQPDIIVSHQLETSKLFLWDLKTNIPVISINHGDTMGNVDRFTFEEHYTWEHVAFNHVLVDSFVEDLHRGNPKVKIEVVGNIVPTFEKSANLNIDKDVYKIIYVGLLQKTIKQPHLLIKSFIRLAKKYPNWVLEMWGDKSGIFFYKSLQWMIKRANLEHRILLKGTSNDIPSKLLDSDICCVPSSKEGFSLAMTEAMSAGLPVVAFASCISLANIIEDGKTGILAEDGVQGLTNALELLMVNRELRVNMGQSAREAMRKYDENKIWSQWESLIIREYRNRK